MSAVYALLDKETGEIRYVGKTTQTLQERLARHFVAARRGNKQHVCNWIRSIEYRVDIMLLEEASSGLEAAEREWISRMRGCARLTNIRDGGEGGGGFKMSAEQRSKIAASNRRRFQNPLARAAVAASNTRRPSRKGLPVNHSSDGLRRMAEANRHPKNESAKAAMRAAARRRCYDYSKQKGLFE